ncbi:MAG: D-2-hydroxyacid dehydrogenase [Myxococcales bacterium]|nr:D-2-hydroxyacid dehydrogenase [Myxococcales bacterium]
MSTRARTWIAAVALVIGCLTTPTSTDARKQLKIVVGRLDPAQVAELRAAVPDVTFVHVASADEALAHIADADALIGILDERLVARGAQLRWIQVLSAGVDRYRYPALVQSDITLTNAKVIQGPNVADQALALLLALTRQIRRAVDYGPKLGWRATRDKLYADKTIELQGKTALVVGYGGIGSAIAERARGFGMRIEAVDPHPEKPHPEWVAALYTPDRLLEALPRADVVFIAAPLTEETEGMIDATALAAMKDGSYLINIARGKIVDTDALVAALRSGKLAGAGLDVTEPEPLPPEHPLWTLDSVVVTPHMGGASDQVWARRMELVQDNVRAFTSGAPLRNVVDKERGY